MSRPSELRKFPISFEMRSGAKYHESCLRSYQVLQATKEWLRLGWPPEVILLLIESFVPANFEAELLKEDTSQ